MSVGIRSHEIWVLAGTLMYQPTCPPTRMLRHDQSSKVRNDARVDGKGARRGSTYPYDHPKHALTTTLPLHDPLDLVSSASARCSEKGGRVPF